MDNQNFNQFQTEEPVSILNWIGTLIVCCIPVVNIIMLIVWAVSQKNATKKNWAIAQLIIMIIGVAGIVLLGASIVGLVESSISSMMY